MKSFLAGFALIAGLVFCVSLMPFAVGAASGADVPLKIGVLDLHKSLNDSQVGQKAKKVMTELIAAKQKVVDGKGAELEKLKTELDKQGTVLSPEAKKQKQDKLEKDIREYQRLVKDTQEELQKKEVELTGAIIKDLKAIVKKLGEEEGYTLIMEKAEGFVLYSSPSYDLTEKAIKKLDQMQKK